MRERCSWAEINALQGAYHDAEWGVPVHDDRSFLAVQAEFGSFDRFIWRFTGGEPRQNRWRTPRQVPAATRESDAMSQDLKCRGFRFVGSTLCYAFMQATGMVNDPLVTCFRHRLVQRGTLNANQ